MLCKWGVADPSDHALFGPLPTAIPSLVGDQGVWSAWPWPTQEVWGSYLLPWEATCFSRFSPSLHPCPLRVASQLPLLEVACISTHTGRGLWEAVTSHVCASTFKKPHLCFWFCHQNGLVVSVPSARTPEPGKQGRATPSNSQSAAVTPADLQIREQEWRWAEVCSSDTALYPLRFSSLLKEKKATFLGTCRAFSHIVLYLLFQTSYEVGILCRFLLKRQLRLREWSDSSEVMILVSDRFRIPNQVFWLHKKPHLHCQILYRDQMRSPEHLIAVSMDGNYRFCTPTLVIRGKRSSPHCV